MADFRRNGNTYEMISKPHGRKEYLMWPTGFRNFWKRISAQEYFAAKNKL